MAEANTDRRIVLEARSLFRMLDRDRSNTVTSFELHAKLSDIGLVEEEIDHIMCNIDADNVPSRIFLHVLSRRHTINQQDGVLTISEFVKAHDTVSTNFVLANELPFMNNTLT